MPPNVTRPCAFVFLRAGDHVLVSEMHDDVEGVFYRPPGGGIEFRETSDAAARRELQEELDVSVGDLTLIGVREEIFTLRGEPNLAYSADAGRSQSTARAGAAPRQATA